MGNFCIFARKLAKKMTSLKKTLCPFLLLKTFSLCVALLIHAYFLLIKTLHLSNNIQTTPYDKNSNNYFITYKLQKK